MKDQLEAAIQSYVFSLFTLGVKMPNTDRGVANLEVRIYEAFSDVLKGYVVDIDVDNSTNAVKIKLK